MEVLISYVGNKTHQDTLTLLLWFLLLDLFLVRIFTHLHTLFFHYVTDFLLQSLWFWELVLLCSWERTLTGCSFVVLLEHSCFTARIGRRTSLERCASACKYLG